MPGSPTANGAPLDLDAHAVPGLLARSDEIKSRARVCVFRVHGAMAPLAAMLTFSAVSDFLANHD
jgi:hypothetical protein